jgi:competence protein ComEA
MPLALVAIQPPSVDSSTLSGSCPQVKPRAPSSRSSCLPETPASIVAWRDREGPFESVDQLMAVKGIGEMTLSRIRDRLSL